MKKMKIKQFAFNFLFLFSVLFSFSLMLPAKAQAVCPVCTVAVGAGLGLSRYLGIDDVITGIWVGGLLFSSGLWLADFLAKKKINFAMRELVCVVIMFVLTFPPLFWANIAGHPGNVLWGIDKLVVGSMIGSAMFMLGVSIDYWLRQTNNQKVYFPYQKVVMPVSLLILSSLAIYFFVV